MQSSLLALSIVVSAADHLFDVRPEKESVFKLSSVTPLDITEGRICFHNARLDKIIQAQEIFVLAKTVQVPPAERQSAKVLVDDIEECTGR